jgi:hypothetical protein
MLHKTKPKDSVSFIFFCIVIHNKCELFKCLNLSVHYCTVRLYGCLSLLFRIALKEESAKEEEIPKVKAKKIIRARLSFQNTKNPARIVTATAGLAPLLLHYPAQTTKRRRSSDCILNSIFSFHSICFKKEG